MTPDDRDHLLLAAYLDGEASPGEVLEMERRLASEPELRRLRDDFAALSGAVRQTVAETPVPADLATRIDRQLANLDALPRRERFRSWHSMAAALLAGLAIGGLAGYGLSGFDQPPKGTATAEAIYAGHLRALAATEPFDIASSDRHTVKPWFNGRTAIAPDAPDLAAEGFPLVGGRIDIVDDKPVPTLVYRRRQHVISVTVVPKNAGGPAGMRRREGSNIERWDAGDLTYFAVSDLNARELGEFAAAFRAATAPKG